MTGSRSNFNAISATTLKLTVPGVPDVYQGNESWDLSLVDPDNRRPVDFAGRIRALASLKQRMGTSRERAALLDEVVTGAVDGRIKLLVVHTLLQHRRAHPDLYADGDYVALDIVGCRKSHAVAYARNRGNERLVIAVPRLVYGLLNGEVQPPLGASVWKDTVLSVPDDEDGVAYQCLFTQQRFGIEDGGLELGRLTEHFPIVALERVGA